MQVANATREHRVERASAADVAALSELLAGVFLDDAGLSWLLPQREVRRQTLPGFFRAIVSGALQRGLVLRDQSHQAVSLWRVPGRIYPGLRESLLGLPSMFAFLKHAGARAMILDKAVRAHAPRVPFRYLQFIGVASEQRGTGRGGALLRAGLEHAARAGEPVYLETSKPDNVGLYAHYGFEIIDEWSVDDAGPRFISMLKRP